MSDKKITQLTEDTSPVLGTDLIPLVGNTAATPTNYKVQVKNFLSQIQIDLPQTNAAAFGLTAGISANATAATLRAGLLSIVANTGLGASTSVKDMEGLKVVNAIQTNNVSVTGRMYAAEFLLDTGNSAVAAANTYGIIINHNLDANTASARKTAPRAYVAIFENPGTNAAAATSYLMDIGGQSLPVSGNATTINAAAVFSKIDANVVATHSLKVNINGTDMWVLVSNAAPNA